MSDLSKENPTVEMLPVDDLIPDENQPRKFHDGDESLKGLIRNIKLGEIFTPIQYRIDEGGKKIIVMGERRWRAAKAIHDRDPHKMATVPALLYIGKEDYRFAAYFDNRDRKKLLPMEEAKYIKYLLSILPERENGQNDLAKKIGLSSSRVCELLQFCKLPDHIQEEALKGPEWTAQKLTLLYKLSGDEQEYEFQQMKRAGAAEADGSNVTNINMGHEKRQIESWQKSTNTISKKIRNAISRSLSPELQEKYQDKIEKIFKQLQETYKEMLKEVEPEKSNDS